MPVPAGRGSLKTVMDRLGELQVQVHPSLSVYRWWRSDMALPALWNWMTPGDVERPDQARVRDLARITMSIGVDPTAIAGEGDMLELEEYVDLALPILDEELYLQDPLGQREARRRGYQTVADTLGDTPILCLEIPLEVYLDRNVPATP